MFYDKILGNFLEKRAGPSFAITLISENEYGTFNAPYPWLKDGVLVEPYKETTLRLLNKPSGYLVSWVITSDSYNMSQSESNADNVKVTMTKTGNYVLNITLSDNSQSISMLRTIFVK